MNPQTSSISNTFLASIGELAALNHKHNILQLLPMQENLENLNPQRPSRIEEEEEKSSSECESVTDVNPHHDERKLGKKKRMPVESFKVIELEYELATRYLCSICHIDFKHKKSLNSHFKKNHPDVNASNINLFQKPPLTEGSDIVKSLTGKFGAFMGFSENRYNASASGGIDTHIPQSHMISSECHFGELHPNTGGASGGLPLQKRNSMRTNKYLRRRVSLAVMKPSSPSLSASAQTASLDLSTQRPFLEMTKRFNEPGLTMTPQWDPMFHFQSQGQPKLDTTESPIHVPAVKRPRTSLPASSKLLPVPVVAVTMGSQTTPVSTPSTFSVGGASSSSFGAHASPSNPSFLSSLNLSSLAPPASSTHFFPSISLPPLKTETTVTKSPAPSFVGLLDNPSTPLMPPHPITQYHSTAPSAFVQTYNAAASYNALFNLIRGEGILGSAASTPTSSQASFDPNLIACSTSTASENIAPSTNPPPVLSQPCSIAQETLTPSWLTQEPEQYTCPICEEVMITRNRKTYMTHLLLHDQQGHKCYQCQLCGFFGKSESEVLSHLRRSCSKLQSKSRDYPLSDNQLYPYVGFLPNADNSVVCDYINPRVLRHPRMVLLKPSGTKSEEPDARSPLKVLSGNATQPQQSHL